MPPTNDPFAAPNSSLSRRLDCPLPRSSGKWDLLFQPIDGTGVPLGGIGTGTITRASDGRFSRWTIKAGGVKSFSLPAAGFALWEQKPGALPTASALQPQPHSPELSAFSFDVGSGDWKGLFPKAWHNYEPVKNRDVRAECLSFSPVLPGNLEASVQPLALFRWRLTNTADKPVETAVLFHFPNLNGWFEDFDENRPQRPSAGCFNRFFDESLTGIVFDRRRTGGELPEGSGEWIVAAEPQSGMELTRTLCFDGTGDGAEFWNRFSTDGRAPDLGPGWLVESGFRESPPGLPTGALSARMSLAPGESREVTFVLAWDLPVIRFGQGRRWFRAYTDQWGSDARASATIAAHALQNAGIWETEITNWHSDICARAGDTPHQAGMAINELYFLTDGLTVYTSAAGSPDGKRHFGIIECHDYALYNTLDLWIYAAEAVGRLYPELAASVAEDFATHLLTADPALRRHRWDANLFETSVAGACPHDLGGPGEDPFVTVNSYTYRDSTIWKDLNCDLVLCIWREGQAMGAAWRAKQFPAVKSAIDHLQQYDRDGDGLIENDGLPDQTFDNIPMKGPSSYCGGLWIAALMAAARLAEDAGEKVLAAGWSAQAKNAAAVWQKRLYNGRYFRVDSDGPLSEACFIEQLFGPFLARRLGLGDIVPTDMARSALTAIYQLNFLAEGGGEGAVSLAAMPEAGADALPHKDDTSFQTTEIQPGFNMSFAAQLQCWGLMDEADTVRKALFNELYVKRNLVFQTPAAIDRGTMSCRAILNMRPMAAWWVLPWEKPVTLPG